MALLELKVRNFAIVDDGALSLSLGMTAFTGETGAGKSLLLDAITLLLGAKARSDLVRTGAKSAEVEGVFDLSSDAERRSRAARLGFEVEAEEESTLLVRREIGNEPGRNRIWIQGRSATRSQLQELLGDWVEVSGQHEFLRLGREDYVLMLVDQFAGLKEECKRFTLAFEELRELQAKLASAREREVHREARLDYLRFQIEELEKAGVHADSASDEEKLLALRIRLGSLEKIRVAFAQVKSLLEGAEAVDSAVESSSTMGALEQVQSMARELRPFENLGEEFAASLRKSDEALNQLQDLSRLIERTLDSLEADPDALEGAEAKLSQFNRLKRKYSLEVSGLVQLLQTAQAELETLNRSAESLEELEPLYLRQQSRLKTMAVSLHRRRVVAASQLEKAWQKDLRLLGMAKARLELVAEVRGELSANGGTRLQTLFSANPGEAPKAIGKVASGGELSRIMLALKHIVAGRSEVAVYLFDEVDAGIGGETAQAVGQRLRALAGSNQVLVVTHLAQIAAKAHSQFRIQKQSEKGRTRTTIEPLDAKDRSLEIARMLGDSDSKAAQNLARELLKRAGEELRGVFREIES